MTVFALGGDCVVEDVVGFGKCGALPVVVDSHGGDCVVEDVAAFGGDCVVEDVVDCCGDVGDDALLLGAVALPADVALSSCGCGRKVPLLRNANMFVLMIAVKLHCSDRKKLRCCKMSYIWVAFSSSG